MLLLAGESFRTILYGHSSLGSLVGNLMNIFFGRFDNIFYYSDSDMMFSIRIIDCIEGPID